MKQAYKDHRFKSASLSMIDKINGIVAEYEAMSMRLTVRQLYYALVSRIIILNNMKSYKSLVKLVTDGREAGLIDWDAIEDRTRGFTAPPHWDSAASVLRSTAYSFDLDRWEDQPYRVWAIVEKDALKGVLQQPCSRWRVPLLAARGYPSASTLREFAKYTMLPAEGQVLRILHLGDHDPSGLDMSRDLADRLEMFTGSKLEIEYIRLGLNRDQVDELSLPENPAKSEDARFNKYVQEHGEKCWELDALPPEYLRDLLDRNIRQFVDMDKWNETQAEVDSAKERLQKVANDFE